MALWILLVAVFTVPTFSVTQQQLADHDAASARSHVIVTGERITDPSKSQANGNQKFITVLMDCPPECAKPNAKINLHLWSTAPKFQEICGHSSIHLPPAAGHGSRDPPDSPDSDSQRDYDIADAPKTPLCTPPDHAVDSVRILDCLTSVLGDIIEQQRMEQHELHKASRGDSREIYGRRAMMSHGSGSGSGSDSESESYEDSDEGSGDERRKERDRLRASKQRTSAEQIEDKKRRHSEYSASLEQSEEEIEDEGIEEGGRLRSSEDRASAEHRERRESQEIEESEGREDIRDRRRSSEDRTSAEHRGRTESVEAQVSPTSIPSSTEVPPDDTHSTPEHGHRQMTQMDVYRMRHLTSRIEDHEYHNALKEIVDLKSVLEPMRDRYGNLVTDALWMLGVVEEQIFPHMVHHDIKKALQLMGRGETEEVQTLLKHILFYDDSNL